jgi:hypothetical protein
MEAAALLTALLDYDMKMSDKALAGLAQEELSRCPTKGLELHRLDALACNQG